MATLGRNPHLSRWQLMADASDPASREPRLDFDSISELVPKARGGSQDARDELIAHIHDYVQLMARQNASPQLQGKFGTSDIAQQSMARVLVGFDGFRGNTKGEFYAWLRTIVTNEARQLHRNYQAGKRDVNRERALAAERSGSLPGFAAIDGELTPRAQAIAAEKVETLHQALSRLPADYAEVIRLRNLEQLTLNEVAERMGRSFDAVRKLWYRGMVQLKDELASSDFSELMEPNEDGHEAE